MLTKLIRYPERHDPSLRAWDAADEYIISHLESNFDLKEKSILIINDSFGALYTNLKEYGPDFYSDSYVSFKGTCLNSGDEIEVINNLHTIKKKYDLVLIKIPKNLTFFEDILCQLTNILSEDGEAIFGGMVKHMPKSNFELVEKYFTEMNTSLAKKKARLIFASRPKQVCHDRFLQNIMIEGMEHTLTNYSNLFSRSKLDIGTRLFLDNIPSDDFGGILDLGCANGVVGIKAKLSNPKSHIYFSDDSAMAITAAKENWAKYFDENEATFFWTNCYEDPDLPQVDLVLCNPPFHQNNTVGDFIAWQMFNDAKRALKKGGRIRVIGNRHLAYHVKLKKVFGNSEVINQNQKFVIIDAYKN
jgi:23S rRNA (guanine1835-N2)-methyltransferase